MSPADCRYYYGGCDGVIIAIKEQELVVRHSPGSGSRRWLMGDRRKYGWEYSVGESLGEKNLKASEQNSSLMQ